jgi:nucleotide-binding universal stress UspA family protein
VVLLTPVVFATAARLRLRPKPHVYACTHLANTASLLLPVSNLTNLLAFRASGLGFARFAATMALPWLVAIAVEWVVLRRFFASDLTGHGEPAGGPAGGVPHYPVAVLALTLAGFGLAAPAGVAPAVVAALGEAALAVPALARRRLRVADLGRAVAVPFLLFVAALGVLVRAAAEGGLGRLVEWLVPAGGSLWSLLAVAVVAAVLLWLVEGTWERCVDAARVLMPAEAEVTLVHVAPGEVEEAAGGALAGLLGRGRPRPGRDPEARMAAVADRAAAELLAAAEARLGRPARQERRRGRVERLVVEAAQDADLLVVARDGNRSRLGPASLGPATRFVVDHAPCPMLLVWPEQIPAVASIPPRRPPRRTRCRSTSGGRAVRCRPGQHPSPLPACRQPISPLAPMAQGPVQPAPWRPRDEGSRTCRCRTSSPRHGTP